MNCLTSPSEEAIESDLTLEPVLGLLVKCQTFMHHLNPLGEQSPLNECSPVY